MSSILGKVSSTQRPRFGLLCTGLPWFLMNALILPSFASRKKSFMRTMRGPLCVPSGFVPSGMLMAWRLNMTPWLCVIIE